MRKLNFDLNQPDFARASELMLFNEIKKVAMAHDELVDYLEEKERQSLTELEKQVYAEVNKKWQSKFGKSPEGVKKNNSLSADGTFLCNHVVSYSLNRNGLWRCKVCKKIFKKD